MVLFVAAINYTKKAVLKRTAFYSKQQGWSVLGYSTFMLEPILSDFFIFLG